MKRLAVAFIALLALSVALAAFAPATLLDTYVQDATRGTVRLTGTSGTIWRGQGQLADAFGAWSIPVGWTLAPLPLVRGEFDLTLVAPEGTTTPRGHIRVQGDSVHLDEVTLGFPAAALRGFFARVPGLQLGGEVTTEAKQFTWLGTSGAGQVLAQWRNANVRALGVNAALGNVTFDTAADAGAIVAHVRNEGGDARIEGDLRFAGNALTGDVLFTPVAANAGELFRLLRMVGTPDASGAIRIRFPNG